MNLPSLTSLQKKLSLLLVCMLALLGISVAQREQSRSATEVATSTQSTVHEKNPLGFPETNLDDKFIEASPQPEAKVADCLPLRDQITCVPAQTWDQRTLYETASPVYILQPRAVTLHGETHYFFVTAPHIIYGDETNPVVLWEYTEKGGLKDIDILPYTSGTGYYFDDNANFALGEDGVLYYFQTYNKSPIRSYDLLSGTINENAYYAFADSAMVVSPNGRYGIRSNDTSITVEDLRTGKKQTVVSQTYDGSWSIGRIVWNTDSKRFYFDNSGPKACIWEFNIEKNELRKIIPEHEAQSQYFFNENGRDTLVYVEGAKLKIATPPEQ